MPKIVGLGVCAFFSVIWFTAGNVEAIASWSAAFTVILCLPRRW